MNDAVTDQTDLFLALADKTRLRILNLLAAGETSVLNFVAALQEPQPKISRHLAYLRDCRLVETRRHGKSIFYRLKPPSDSFAAHILNEVLRELAKDSQMAKDRARQNQRIKQAANNRAQNESEVCAETDASSTAQNLPVFLL